MSTERNFAEANQPRPIAIDVGTNHGFAAIDKIIRWNQEPGSDNVKIWTVGREHPLVVYDAEHRIDTALRELFRLVTP